jgi:predicted nucleic acid-binding protein
MPRAARQVIALGANPLTGAKRDRQKETTRDEECWMRRFVITPDVALELARRRATVAAPRALVAPTLLRSHVLARLFEAVRGGAFDRREAEGQLDHLRGLRIRLLGDRVLQSRAWTIADQLGWADTYMAEYVALTALQADAFVTLDYDLARAASAVVATAPIDILLDAETAPR